MARGDSLARQLQLIQILETRRSVAVVDMAEELGATRRTVYRDLQVLERVGVPIYQDRVGARSRWRVVEGYQRHLSLTLSFSETLALATGRDLLAGLSGTLFHEAAVSALEKIRAVLPREIAARASAAAARLSSPAAVHDYSRASEAIHRLIEAMDRQETVRIAYRKPGDRAGALRTVDPYHLHVQAGALYLIGWCHDRAAVRTFLLHRAGEVKGTGKTFQRRASFAPADFVHGEFGPWSGKAQRLRLRFDARAAPYVAERRVHASQVSQLSSDGSLEVRLTAPVGPGLMAWLMGWGAAMEVLAPRKLAQAVAREHRKAAGKGPRR